MELSHIHLAVPSDIKPPLKERGVEEIMTSFPEQNAFVYSEVPNKQADHNKQARWNEPACLQF